MWHLHPFVGLMCQLSWSCFCMGTERLKTKVQLGACCGQWMLPSFVGIIASSYTFFKLWEILPPAYRVILVLLYKQVTSGTWWTTLHSAFVFPLVLTYYITIHSTEANRKNGVQHFLNELITKQFVQRMWYAGRCVGCLCLHVLLS